MSSQKKFLPKLYPLKRNIERVWFVEYTDHQGRKQKIYDRLNSLTTVEERLKHAESIIDGLYRDHVVMPGLGQANQLIRDLNEIYELRMSSWKQKSKSAYKTHFYEFARWFRANGCPPFNAIAAMKFLNFILDRSTATTRNNYRHNLKSLFADLQTYYKARYADNPFAQVRKIQEARATKEWFKPSQVGRLRDYISKTDPDLLRAVKFMFHCFARPNEIRQLKVGDIVFETSKLRITSLVAKTSRIRHVTIPPELLSELQGLRNYPESFYIFTLAGEPGAALMGRDTLSKRHKKVMQALDFPKGYSFYSWKNTGAVKMMMMDRKPIRYISKQMGHHSLDMTDYYFQSLGVDEMEEQIIFPSLSEATPLIGLKAV